jgi:dihydrofolate reductase
VARLVYAGITSLDGYTVDANGSFEWAAPDDEVHAFVNDLERGVGTYLYGRRLYETMRVWQTVPEDEGPEVARDFGRLWREADKVVYSATLAEVTTPRTRLERTFEPWAVRALVDAADRDVSVGGATLAAAALRAGLVDELHQLLHPVVVGGGTPYLPGGVHLDLELLGERRFGSGVVHLHHAVLR